MCDKVCLYGISRKLSARILCFRLQNEYIHVRNFHIPTAVFIFNTSFTFHIKDICSRKDKNTDVSQKQLTEVFVDATLYSYCECLRKFSKRRKIQIFICCPQLITIELYFKRTQRAMSNFLMFQKIIFCTCAYQEVRNVSFSENLAQIILYFITSPEAYPEASNMERFTTKING